MQYGGKPLKPVPPPAICIPRNMGYNGPQPCTYGILAKQPGNDYKIRRRDMERERIGKLKMKLEDDYKTLIKNNLHKQFIDVGDRKYIYNQIKRMVEWGMKANEHLFLEEPTKPELEEEDKPVADRPEITIEELIAKIEALKKINDEEERKSLEGKRLKISEEIMIAGTAKRKKELADIYHNTVKERERFIKEEGIRKREQANIENLEIFKMQALEKKEEQRKCLVKKEQFRKELYEQVQEKEVLRIKEKELKLIEREELKMWNVKLREEEELKKLQSKQKYQQRKEEIKKFIEVREKLLSQIHDVNDKFNEAIAATMEPPKWNIEKRRLSYV